MALKQEGSGENNSISLPHCPPVSSQGFPLAKSSKKPVGKLRGSPLLPEPRTEKGTNGSRVAGAGLGVIEKNQCRGQMTAFLLSLFSVPLSSIVKALESDLSLNSSSGT